MENKICIYTDYEYQCVVFEDINVFCSTIKKYFKQIKSQYYFSKNDLFAILLISFKVKFAEKNTKIREEEIKDSYTCDCFLGHMPSFIVADKNGKIIFKTN